MTSRHLVLSLYLFTASAFGGEATGISAEWSRTYSIGQGSVAYLEPRLNDGTGSYSIAGESDSSYHAFCKLASGQAVSYAGLAASETHELRTIPIATLNGDSTLTKKTIQANRTANLVICNYVEKPNYSTLSFKTYPFPGGQTYVAIDESTITLPFKLGDDPVTGANLLLDRDARTEYQMTFTIMEEVGKGTLNSICKKAGLSSAISIYFSGTQDVLQKNALTFEQLGAIFRSFSADETRVERQGVTCK